MPRNKRRKERRQYYLKRKKLRESNGTAEVYHTERSARRTRKASLRLVEQRFQCLQELNTLGVTMFKVPAHIVKLLIVARQYCTDCNKSGRGIVNHTKHVRT